MWVLLKTEKLCKPEVYIRSEIVYLVSLLSIMFFFHFVIQELSFVLWWVYPYLK